MNATCRICGKALIRFLFSAIVEAHKNKKEMECLAEMEEDKIQKIMQLEPEQLRTQLNNLSTDDLREIAFALANKLEYK